MQKCENLFAGFAFFKPKRDVPLAPSLIVGTGVDQPPLYAVGEEGKFLLALAKPFDHAGNAAAAGADADLLYIVVKDRQNGPIASQPESAGFEVLAGDEAMPPLGTDGARLLPLQRRKLQDAFKDRIEQCRLRTELLSILLSLDSAPKAPCPVVGKLRFLSREIVRKPGRGNEQATVLE